MFYLIVYRKENVDVKLKSLRKNLKKIPLKYNLFFIIRNCLLLNFLSLFFNYNEKNITIKEIKTERQLNYD